MEKETKILIGKKFSTAGNKVSLDLVMYNCRFSSPEFISEWKFLSKSDVDINEVLNVLLLASMLSAASSVHSNNGQKLKRVE